MNAIYALPDGSRKRSAGARRLWTAGTETICSSMTPDPSLTVLRARDPTVWSPRVLKDGADSVGALGALNRVYLSIGLFSEEWLLHFNPLIGGKPTTPIQIADNRRNSSILGSNRTADARDGAFLPAHHGTAQTQGRSRRREVHHLRPRSADPRQRGFRGALRTLPFEQASGAGSWPRSQWMLGRRLPRVLQPLLGMDEDCRVQEPNARYRAHGDFLDDNYLSTDVRVPVTLLQTNACSPLATNAIAGNIWDNYSSQTYKNLPSVGTITVHDPLPGRRGRTPCRRWARLHAAGVAAQRVVDGAVSAEQHGGTVQRRSFGRGTDGLLRGRSSRCCGRRSATRTRCSAQGARTDRPHDRVELSPGAGRLSAGLRADVAPWQETGSGGRRRDGIELGPIPEGTPVNLLTNLNLLPDSRPRAEARARQEAPGAPGQDQARPQVAADGRHRRAGAQGLRQPGEADARAQQVSRTSWSTVATTSAPTASRRSRVSATPTSVH